jgi:hypothetical protein
MVSNLIKLVTIKFHILTRPLQWYKYHTKQILGSKVMVKILKYVFHKLQKDACCMSHKVQSSHITRHTKFKFCMSHVTPSSKLTSQTKFKVHVHGTNAFCMLHIACRNIFKDGCRMSQDFERCMSQVVIFFKFFLQLPKTSYCIFPKIYFCMLHQV